MNTPKKIIIIDDEPKIVKAFCDAFRFEKGFVVDGFTDGAKALAYLKEGHPIDLIILDWRLKGEVQGRDVLMYAKANVPETPVWVVTASIHFFDEIGSYEPAMTFLKPCAELKAKVMSFLLAP